MSLLGAHLQKLAVLLQNLFFPSCQFARAVCSDWHCALLRGLLPLLDGPRSILHPTEYALDQTPIPGRPKRPSQMAVAVRARLVPTLTIGHCLRPLLADGLQSLDRDVQISHGAELGVQPLQFIPYSSPLGVIDHWREKYYRCAQPRKRDAHLMQGSGVASVCRLMICGQIFKTAARYNSKCGVARHRWIQSQGWVGGFVLRRHGPRSGFT